MKSNNKFLKSKKHLKILSKNDPFGSYTGNSLDGKAPIQDADDL